MSFARPLNALLQVVITNVSLLLLPESVCKGIAFLLTHQTLHQLFLSFCYTFRFLLQFDCVTHYIYYKILTINASLEVTPCCSGNCFSRWYRQYQMEVRAVPCEGIDRTWWRYRQYLMEVSTVPKRGTKWVHGRAADLVGRPQYIVWWIIVAENVPEGGVANQLRGHVHRRVRPLWPP